MNLIDKVKNKIEDLIPTKNKSAKKYFQECKEWDKLAEE